VTNSVWKLEGTTARFDDGRLRAAVDLSAPQRGLVVSARSGRSAESESSASCLDGILAIDLGKVAADDLSLPETYARVDDLVATYLQTESRPYRLQAYWRRVDLSARANLSEATAIDLQVSINTSLLDTRPSIIVKTLGSGTVERSTGERSYSIVRTAAGFTYFEAVHPNDERRPVGTDTGAIGTHALFGDFLEKGVIVRARIRAAFLPAQAGKSDFDALYDDFVSEPLPLTT
jgi:hypothetical protein